MSYFAGAKNSLYANPERLYGPIPTHDWLAPIPGWGMNPNWAGPARVGIGATEESTIPVIGLLATVALAAGLVYVLAPRGRRA